MRVLQQFEIKEITQNIAKTRLQRKRAKLVEGWMGGSRSSWFT